MRTRLFLLCIGVGSFLYSVAQPANNNCGNAILITALDGTCQTGMDGALATEDVGAFSCSGASNENVWFRFVADGYSAQIMVTNGPSTPEITIVSFPSTPCDGATAQEVECATGTTVTLDNQLVLGNTYYIMVAFAGGTDGTFDICVNNPEPASNDNCLTATPLVNLDNACFNANNEFPSTDILIPGCFTGSTYNVWYSFVAVGVSLDVYVPNGGPGVGQLAVIDFAAPCTATGAVSLGCATGTNHIMLDNVLVVGDTYYVVVGFQNSNFNGMGIGDYEICIDNPIQAVNDDCDMAIPIPTNVLNDPTTCFTTIGGNMLNNDWPSTDIGTFACWNGDNYNIWYSFVAQGPDVAITVDPAFAQDAQIALVQFTGTPCQFAGAQVLSCAYDMILDYNDQLIIGNTYYIAVGFENNGVGDFCMNVFNPEPPPNDLPCDAIMLPTDNDCTNGTTIYANPEGYFVPGNCQNAIQNTVWYTLTLGDPDNVGFNIDFDLDDVFPQSQLTIVLWETNNCNQPGNIVFYQCGPPPTTTLEWGPVQPGITYLLSVTTPEVFQSDFQICVDEVPPCFTNDLCTEATLIPNVISDMAFVCVDGCNLFADPELLNSNVCGIDEFPTVWFQVQTDGSASLMNIFVNSLEFDAPTISLFQQTTDCNSLVPINLTAGNLPCIVGSNGEAEALGSAIGANTIYYIAVSSFNNVGGEFELCVNTISVASACVTSREIVITSRSSGGPLEGPFFPGETVSVCMNVNSYTAAVNGCQWFQGLIPVFGNGWDPSSFDADGQPINATLNGNAIGVPGNGLYSTATWDWITDADYHYNNTFFQIGDFDGNGTVEMCNILYDPNCPNLGGITGGCCGPCWGAPLGDFLPGGWFAYGIDGSCNGQLGPPVRLDWGDGNTCGGGMGPWHFCFDLDVRPYPECLDDATTMDLGLGFFTTADGETGSWTGSASVCALDQPASVTLPMCCTELMEGEEELDPICSSQLFLYVIDEPGVDYWTWTVSAGSVTGALPGSGGPGYVVINTLTNSGTDSELVTYTFLGFAGGACPVFQKEVTIEVYPQIRVVIGPQVMCATPTMPYVIEPDVSGGNGVYEYQWAPNGETTPTITVPNPVNGTIYTVSVTDNVGCFATASVSITVYSTFPVDIIAPIVEQCIQDGPLSLEATASGGADPYDFEWMFPDGSGSMNDQVTSDQPGKHIVTVTDDEGCVGKDSVIIMFNETPEVYIDAVNGALAICEGESSTLSGVASLGNTPYYYEWDTPGGNESGKNIEATIPGIYVVTVTDGKGCTASAELEIESQPTPMPDLGPDILVCNFAQPVELTVTEDFEEYQWSVGSAANGLQSISVSMIGTYTVTVTNEFGCTGEVSINVGLYPQPVFVIPDTFEICPGNCVTIDADAYGGPWEDYEWGQCPGCGNEFDACSDGEYQVTVFDENNCTGYQEFFVFETATLDPGLTGDDTICLGETIILAAAPGFISYQWSANAGGVTTSTASVTAPGTYSVTVEDNTGCSGKDSITIGSGDFIAAITGPTAICANVMATLDAGAGFTSYLWSTGAPTRMVTVDDGTYTVTVTNSNGCTSTATHTIIETPFVPVITGDNMICLTGESSTLDAGGPYVSYIWSANAGSATTQTITTSTTGLYTVTVVDQVGCVGNAAFTIANHPVPFVAITGSPDFCVGGNTQMTATAGYTYVWSTSEPTQAITINTAGPYSVTVTDANGCTNSAVTTVNTPFQETVQITGTLTFCPGDQATLAVAGGYASVLWSTMETTDQIIVTVEDTFSVIVIDASGCIAYDTVVTDQNINLNPMITGDSSICDAGTAVMNAGAGYDNYVWSGGLGTSQTASVNMPGIYSVTVSSNSGCIGEDDFEVIGFISPFATVTPTASACDLQEPGGPSTIIDFNSLVTAGDQTGSWIQDSGPSTVNLSNLANVNFSGLNPGTYTFTYTTATAVEPCTDKPYQLTVTITSCACPPVDLGVAPDLCNDLGSISLSTLVLPQTASGGAWTVINEPPGSNPAVIVPPDIFDANGADPGLYTLQYELSGLAAYCDPNSTVTINVLRTPVAGVATAPLEYCFGENQVVTLSSLINGEDAGGIWNESSQYPSTGGAFNSTTGTFNVSLQVPGTYTFDYVIMGSGPCPDDMTTVEVVIEANPVADAGTTATLDCTQSTAALGGSGTSTGSDFSYLWTATNGGTLTQSDIPNPIATSAGTYTLVVTNNVTGCSATDQVVIDQVGDFPTDMVLLVQSPDCEGDPPGSMQVSSVVGGISPFSYSLNNAPPVASPVFNNLTPGHYSIEVTDATGCKLSDTFTIYSLVEVDLNIVDYVNGDFVFLLGDTITLSYTYIGSTAIPDSSVWKLGDSVLCINCPVLELEAYLAGTITLEAYDTRGCYSKDAISFQVVRNREVYLPNVFSPNGDNLNDYFTLFTDADVTDITLLEIYDRWGDLVFRKPNFQPNIPSEGWDGKFDGQDVNPGVYVYRIEFIYGDGLRDNLAGDVTIIR